MASFPTKARIGLHDYAIEDWHRGDATSAGKYGDCSSMLRRIRIDRSYGPRQTASVLLHELMHAAYAEWHIEGKDEEERTVGTLSDAMSCIWRDNPEMFDWVGKALIEDREDAATF